MSADQLKHYRVTIELHAMTDTPAWLDEMAQFFVKEGLANLQYEGWYYQEDHVAAVVQAAQEIPDGPESLPELRDAELSPGSGGTVIRHCPD